MRKSVVGAALLAALLVLGGCGGDSEAGATEIDVTTTDFNFTPDQWNIAAGEEITLNFTNDGAVAHEWVILKSGVRISSEADLPETEAELLADFVYWEEEFGAGESGSFTFTAPEAGNYQIVCALEGHYDAGMEGILKVTG